MHVALFAPAWPPSVHPNGVVTYVHWLRDALASAGHRVSVVTPTLGGQASGAVRVEQSRFERLRDWVRVRTGASGTFPIFDWDDAIATSVAAIHRRTPIDIVEMEESFGWFAGVQRVLPMPVVVRLHGPAFLSLVEDELDTPLGREKIEREGRALREHLVITSPARRTLDETAARYAMTPPMARHVVNPLRLPDDAPIWRLDRCDRRELLFVGRFDKRKGGDVMLRAFRALLDTRPDLSLVFVGPDKGIDGSGFTAWHGRLFPGPLADRVRFRGALTAKEIPALRANAFATVIASRWENQSYTLLEAMLQGCPTVSSDAGGHAEVIDHGRTGLLFRAGDAGDLECQLRVLLDDPLQASRMGAAARRHASVAHSPETVVAHTLDVYAGALDLANSFRQRGRGHA